MKNLIYTLCFILSSIGLFAQEETRTLSDFHSLDVSGGISVELLDGRPKAEIKLEKGDLDKLVTEVRNGVLKIKFEKKSWFSWGDQKAHITLYGADELKAIDASAGSYVYSAGMLVASDFSLSLSSGAKVEIGLDANTVSASASSGASAELKGRSRGVQASASSGASIDARELESSKATATASSGAAVILWVKDELTASVSSGGSVKYKGEPAHTNIDSGKYSGGSVSKL